MMYEHMSQCLASASLFHTLTKIESELWEALQGGIALGYNDQQLKFGASPLLLYIFQSVHQIGFQRQKTVSLILRANMMNVLVIIAP